MPCKNKKPKSIDLKIIESLRNELVLGEYCRYSVSSQLPDGVPWGGPNSQCVVVAASWHNGSEIPGLPPNMSPQGNVYLWRGFRTITGDSPMRKVDDCLYYQSDDGRAWRLHSKDSPDHHWYIMSGSGLGALIQDYDLPSASRGNIADYRSEGASLDFEEPFRKRYSISSSAK